MEVFLRLYFIERTGNRVSELMSIVTTKTEDPTRRWSSWKQAGLGSPSGNFWLAFMILAILQSDNFNLFFCCCCCFSPTRPDDFVCFKTFRVVLFLDIQTSVWLTITNLLTFNTRRNCPTVSLERHTSTHSLNTLPVLPPPPHRPLIKKK